MTSPIRAFGATILPLFALACGSTTATSTASTTVADRALPAAAETLFSYGQAFGPPEEMLGDEVHVGFDGSGQLHILDVASYRVITVSPEGEYIREFGRQGEGPGEFSTPLGIVVDDDGSIAVLDGRARSFTRFDASGEYVGDTRTDIGFAPEEQKAHLTSAGEVVFLGAGARSRRSDSDSTATTTPIRRVSLSDGGSEVVHAAWRPRLASADLDELDRGWSPWSRPQAVAFLPEVQVGGLADGRIAVMDSTTYEIDILGPDGRVERTITRDIAPRPVTDGLEDRELDRRSDALESGDSELLEGILTFAGSISEAGRQRILESELERLDEMEFGPEIPVIRRMAADRRGFLWVERTPDRLAGPGPIDIIAVDGGYLGTFEAGTMRIPDAFGPDGLAAFIERDEWDVPSIVVRRLPELLQGGWDVQRTTNVED